MEVTPDAAVPAFSTLPFFDIMADNINQKFPEQTASYSRHAPLFPDTSSLLLWPCHPWNLVR
jgi:hypothetical protein